MTQIKHGTLELNVSEHVAPHPQAGSLSAKDVAKLPRAPRDVGGLCELIADLLDTSPGSLPLPEHITPDALRLAASAADDTDNVISDLEYMLGIFKQSNLLHDAHAWKLAREVNSALQARAKFDPKVAKRFASVIRYFKRRNDKSDTSSGATEAQPDADSNS